MADAAFAAIGAIGGTFVTATCSFAIFLIRRRSVSRSEHLRRAFEQHLVHYESVFVSARTVQDALRNFMAISRLAADRSDPFLFQILEIAAEAAYQYCVSVSWTHNPGMVYLDVKLEEKCLRARDLLLEWLSHQRIRFGDVATIRRQNLFSQVPLKAVGKLRVGDYQELRIERRRMVVAVDGDGKRLLRIDRVISSVIIELKAVMAY